LSGQVKEIFTPVTSLVIIHHLKIEQDWFVLLVKWYRVGYHVNQRQGYLVGCTSKLGLRLQLYISTCIIR